MKIIVSGRNIDLTRGIKDHVIEKMRRLSEHFDFIQEIHVFLSVEKNPSIKENQKAEATVHVNGAIVRVGAAKSDLYAGIDELLHKIERALRKHKTRLMRDVKQRAGTIRKPAEGAATPEAPATEESGETPDDSELFLTYQDAFADDEEEEGEAVTAPAAALPRQ
ncbi:MAG: ribosome-associated translation inhibitor RaiA [Vampirovibrionales bacterium]|nr:ribosome-associated translation inhibitor RaiA [Vampirovibrionales bacterium]